MNITESASHEELTRMFDAFLYLDRSGWKLRKGTSIAQIKKSMYFHHADSQNGYTSWNILHNPGPHPLSEFYGQSFPYTDHQGIFRVCRTEEGYFTSFYQAVMPVELFCLCPPLLFEAEGP